MEAKVTAAQIAAKYNLTDLKEVEKTREENFFHVDSKKRNFKIENVRVYAIVAGFKAIIKSQQGDFDRHNWIDKHQVVEDLYNIYTICSPWGTKMLVDKIYLSERNNHPESKTEIWCTWATEGKVNLLLDWGWKDEYFLKNRETWGHDKCSYKITVDNDLATVIKELWKKGNFSDNYADAYYQIKKLLETGEIPEIPEKE